MLKKLLQTKIHIFILLIFQLVLASQTIHAFISTQYEPFSYIALLLVLIIPCILLRCKGISPVFRFITIYLAFIPAFNPALFGEIIMNDNPFSVGFTINHCITLLSIFSMELFAVMLILFMLYLKSGFALNKWLVITFATAGILGVGMLVFPILSEVCLYLISYLFIIITFYFMEKTFDIYCEKYEKIAFRIFISVLFFRGIYQMLSILKVYPLA